MRISEMEEEIRHREGTIRNLEEQIDSLQSGIDDMSKELELKGKEILQIRSEANQAAKYVQSTFSDFMARTILPVGFLFKLYTVS